MYILYDRPNILFLGYSRGGYQFALHCDDDKEPTLIALNRLKYVCGGNKVFYCEQGGAITRNWKPIGEHELKSIANSQKKNTPSEIVSKLKKLNISNEAVSL